MTPADERLYIAVPIVSEGTLLGSLVAVYSEKVFAPRFAAMVERAGVVTLLVLAALLPFSWYWGQRMAEPMVQLSAAMAKVGPDIPDPAQVEVYRSRDELGQVGEAFRRMLVELQEKESLRRQAMNSERLAAVGRLTAGIAHEINNPLGGMLNAVSTYKRHGNADPLAEKTVALLERGLLQIRDTVSALLVEARPAGHPLTPQDAEDTHTLVLADARKRHVELAWHNGLAGALPLPAHLVRQVLLNLLLNAVQAAGEGGRVAARVEPDDAVLRIEVRNTGRHIGEAERDRLFEPFALAGENGHGLGLWVTYQIVRQLGGSIDVVSRPDDTVFSVALPVEEAS